MNSVEIEQLKNNLAVKVGILEIKIKNGEINDDTSVELVNSYKEYEEKGTTIEELKLLFDDVILALS
jgi:hypothetical protein